MKLLALLKKWLAVTPQTGKAALAVAVVAIVLPTILQLSLERTVWGAGLLVYFPFVMLAAILLEWKAATIIMLVSALLADWLFGGPHHRLLQQPSDMFEVAMFLSGLTVIIALVYANRTTFRQLVGPTSKGGAFFSVEEGQAWASWPEAGFHLRLGPQDEVAGMMKDYLAQLEVVQRLAVAAQAKDTQSISGSCAQCVSSDIRLMAGTGVESSYPNDRFGQWKADIAARGS